ncbi:hypothetical protein STFR1_20100 [Bacillus vallismortis]
MSFAVCFKDISVYIANIIKSVITVGFSGKWLNMYPSGTAVINACHSG